MFFILGIISTLSVVSGDSSGRVNLLYLVLLYVLLPLFSLIMLIVLSITKSSSWFNIFSQSSIWPRRWHESLLELKRAGLLSPWLFFQSQKLLLIFNASCLLSFLMVLLFNDLSFVWRSTLLLPEHVFPVLSAIALPWTFIESAQPVYQLIASTQDSRLSQSVTANVDYGSWWQFLMAAQITYGVLPRLLLVGIAKYRFHRQLLQSQLEAPQHLSTLINRQPDQTQLASIVDSGLPTNFTLVQWTLLPNELLTKVCQQVGLPQQQFVTGCHATIEQEQIAQNDPRPKLVIVAAWEPPMGELKDFLEQGNGFLLPLDWQDNGFTEISPLHIDEWRRFCHPLANWQLLQLKDLL